MFLHSTGQATATLQESTLRKTGQDMASQHESLLFTQAKLNLKA